MLRIVGILSVVMLAVGCGGHDCKAFNQAICDRASACGYTSCNVDSCPGHEKVDFSACIDATRQSTCVNFEATVGACRVPG